MKVAIEMITYNHGGFIRQAIESVMAQQTNFTYCLYIFEDCSTDNTAEICSEFAKRYPDKIKLNLNRVNLGVMRNAKLMHDTTFATSAKYIAMCEGDDYWIDHLKLQKQVDFMEANEGFAICFHKVAINKAGEIIQDYITKVPSIITTQSDLLRHNNYIHTPSVLIRSKNIFMPDWFSTAMPGDYPLYIIATNSGGKIFYFEEEMAHYRIHTGGIWSMQSPRKNLQQLALTMFNCAMDLKISEPVFINRCASTLADSVYYLGYQSVSRGRYLRLIKWAVSKTRFSPKRLLYFLSPDIRRRIKKPKS